MKNQLKLGITAAVLAVVSITMSVLTIFVIPSITLGIGGLLFGALAVIAGYHAVSDREVEHWKRLNG